MRRRGFLAAALAAGIAPAVCKADSLMRIVVPRASTERWSLSVGGVLVGDDRLLIGDWEVREVSIVEVPIDDSSWIHRSIGNLPRIPADQLTLEFKVDYIDHEALRRLASQRM